ncbi:MAG: divergent polysaccharide deacetylase family protein [Desulforhopalus sp.]
MLIFSVCAAGYVIFFRAAFAFESGPTLNADVVFEEPDPPHHIGDLDRKSTVPDSELPRVAIIFDDIGHDKVLGEKLLSSPMELTYSFLPFAPFTEELEQLASLAGKTIFLHLPLEPKSKEWDPGPGALLLDDSPEEQIAKFKKCLDRVPHAIGVNTHMGSLYTEDAEAMQSLMREVDRRSLLFVDSYTSASSFGLKSARELGVTSGRRHVFLDNVLDEEKICNQLSTLVLLAEKQGWAIGIAHPHQVTVAAIDSCSKKFSARVQYVNIKDLLYSDPFSAPTLLQTTVVREN